MDPQGGEVPDAHLLGLWTVWLETARTGTCKGGFGSSARDRSAIHVERAGCNKRLEKNTCAMLKPVTAWRHSVTINSAVVVMKSGR